MRIRCCHNPRSSYYCLIERSWDHNEKIKKNSTVLSSARASSTASYFRPSTGLNRKELFGTFNRLILLQADDRYIMGGAWGEGHMRRRRGSVLGLPGRRRRRQRSRRRCCNAAMAQPEKTSDLRFQKLKLHFSFSSPHSQSPPGTR